MAHSQWRRFQFFDKGWDAPGLKVSRNLGEALRGTGDSDPLVSPDSAAFLPARRGSATFKGRPGSLFFGDDQGRVHVTDEDCMVTHFFKAFPGPVRGVRVAMDARSEPILVVIGAIDELVWAVKIFRVDALLLTQGAELEAEAVRVVPLPLPPSRPAAMGSPQLTAFAVSSSCTQVAVGFSNGAVVLLRGPLASSSKLKPPLLLLAPEAYGVLEGDKVASVSCLIFGERAVNMGRGVPAPRLFVVTHGGGRSGGTGRGSGVVCAYDVSESGVIDKGGLEGGAMLPLVVLDDDEGGRAGCCAHDPSEHQIVVGRDDAVYSFTAEDRAGAAGFEGRKQALARLPGEGGPAQQPGYVVVASHNDKSGRTEVNVYDLANKLVAFNHRLDPTTQVASLLTGAGTAYVLTASAKDRGLSVVRLRERPTAAKLDVLFKMSQYSHGIYLATNAKYPAAEINKMILMFADHKYRKCDWDGAIIEYCKTIGFTEPSYVIRKFLDAQRIHNLTSYLEKLHELDAGSHATGDHTTLLLNCYTKLKDVKKLHRFIASDHATFDIETAVFVLRSSGYLIHALDLARRSKHRKQHDWIMQILLLDSTNGSSAVGSAEEAAAAALAHVRQQDPELQESLLCAYGKAMMKALPDATTLVVTDLCTAHGSPLRGRPEALFHLFVDHSAHLRRLLEAVHASSVASSSSSVSRAAADTLLELTLRDWSAAKARAGKGPAYEQTRLVPDGPFDPLLGKKAPVPAVAPRPSAAAAAATAAAERAEADAATASEARAVMSLLRSPSLPYDRYHALVLVQVHDLKEGQLLLLEHLSKDATTEADLGGVVTDLLVDQHLAAGRIDEMVRVCKRESNASGRPSPNLWAKVLGVLVARCVVGDVGVTSGCENEEDLEEAFDLLQEFLDEVDKDKILPPLQVLDSLATNPSLPLSVAHKFLGRLFSSAVECIDDHRSQINQLRVKTATMSGSMGSPVSEECSSAAQRGIERGQNSGAAGVYTEAHKWEEMKRSMSKGAADNEARFAELHRSRDGFSVIAKFFGEGMVK